MHSLLSLSPSTVALLLIDLQEEQRSDPAYAAANIDTVLKNAGDLLKTARDCRIPVFHAAYRRDFAICPPRPFEPRSDQGRPCFSDTNHPLTEFCPEVTPLPGETVIIKNDSSAFEQGMLTAKLHQLGIEWIAIAGVWTEQCVAASVRDAMKESFRVLLVKDACGSGSETMHRTALLNLANRLFGGGVADTERAVALMKGGTATVWRTDKPVPIRFTLSTIDSHYTDL